MRGCVRIFEFLTLFFCTLTLLCLPCCALIFIFAPAVHTYFFFFFFLCFFFFFLLLCCALLWPLFSPTYHSVLLFYFPLPCCALIRHYSLRLPLTLLCLPCYAYPAVLLFFFALTLMCLPCCALIFL